MLLQSSERVKYPAPFEIVNPTPPQSYPTSSANPDSQHCCDKIETQETNRAIHDCIMNLLFPGCTFSRPVRHAHDDDEGQQDNKCDATENDAREGQGVRGQVPVILWPRGW